MALRFTFKNPTESHFGEIALNALKAHHIMRAKQVLFINQNAERFPREGFGTFIGSGGSTDARQESPGNLIRVPRQTTRRNLSTLQPQYMPFPGRIYFVNAQSNNLIAAFSYFMKRFVKESPKGGNFQKKGHTAQYSKSLLFVVDGVFTDAAGVINALKNKATGSVIDIINSAPHASTIEQRIQVMYDIAIGTSDAYGPGVTIQYDYINSDRMGLKYGTGTGGPTPQTARASSRPYPVTYALPRVRFAVNSSTISNSRFIAPGRQASMRAVRKGRSVRPRRS